MRTLRLYLAGMVIIALLGGLGGAALAQDEPTDHEVLAEEDPVEWSVFTGETTCGLRSTEEWLVDDPRVTGPCSVTIEQQVGDAGGYAGVGTFTVNGPDGDWIGRWAVAAFAPMLGRNFVVLEGTDAYAGWTVWAWATEDDDWWPGDPFDLAGVIFEGPPPPWGGLQPPIE